MSLNLESLTAEERSRLVDIDNIFATKFRGKKISPFLIRLAKKILRQDALNELVARTTEDGEEFCTQMLREMGVSLEIEGLENIPADGTLYTFASNHPLGGADGMALCGIIGEHFGRVSMPVNDFLTFIKPIAPLCVPINKVGSQARNLPALMDSAFGSDRQIMIFPAGLCSRRIKGVISDLAWTKTFLTKSIATQRAIVPVHFVGQNSRRFYFVANLCKWLKLKFNLAMILLPDEVIKAKGKTYKMVFGKPIPYTHFDKSKSVNEWVKWIREIVYNL